MLFLSLYKISTSSGKHSEGFSEAHILSLLYEIIINARDTDDLSIGFDRSRARRKQEMTNNKKVKGKYHVKNYSKAFFGFAELQEKDIYGLGYKLTLTRASDNSVLNKGNEINIAKIKINSIDW